MDEIADLFDDNISIEIKCSALNALKEISGSLSGIQEIVKADLLPIVGKFINHDCHKLSNLSISTLINVTAEEFGALSLVRSKSNPHILSTLKQLLIDPTSKNADNCCIILNNITHHSNVTEEIIEFVGNPAEWLSELMQVFKNVTFNKNGCSLHNLAAVFANLTQCEKFRRCFLDPSQNLLQDLLPFTMFEESAIRRLRVISTIKNCCFETDAHTWLLSDEVDILPHLLLPLAGNEEFDEEDNSKLPLELQYLDNSKTREVNSEIRTMILEILLKLCTTKFGRQYLRDKNAYIILRELHKWETDNAAKFSCENVVDILIRTEEEIGVENIETIEVPKDLTEKFYKMDVKAKEGA